MSGLIGTECLPFFLAVKVTMEAKFSDVLLQQYMKIVEGKSQERIDEQSFVIHFDSSEGRTAVE